MTVEAATAVPLWLDHASVEVPDLPAAIEHLDRRLGLQVTVSPAAPERHGRVLLDRSYLEVALGSATPGWRAPLFFLRFEDPIALRRHLEAEGLGYRFGEYQGVDGTWDDVEIHADPVAMPILVRRTRPPEVARSWPPALGEPHRCGARALAEVGIGVPSLDAAIDPYRRLLALDEPEPSTDHLSGRRRVDLPTVSGRIVLLEGGNGEVERLVLGVDSVELSGRILDRRLTREGDPVAWLDPAETFGLRLGFVEA